MHAHNAFAQNAFAPCSVVYHCIFYWCRAVCFFQDFTLLILSETKIIGLLWKLSLGCLLKTMTCTYVITTVKCIHSFYEWNTNTVGGRTTVKYIITVIVVTYLNNAWSNIIMSSATTYQHRILCIYQVSAHTLDQIHPDDDLQWYSLHHGAGMPYVWPEFEVSFSCVEWNIYTCFIRPCILFNYRLMLLFMVHLP